METKRRRKNYVSRSQLPRIESLEARRLMAVFTVTNTGDSGPGSLRAAIEQSNNTPGLDTIAFNIAASDKTIRVASGLPSIYDAAIVDGTTQPGYAGKPLIRIDGSAAGSARMGSISTAVARWRDCALPVSAGRASRRCRTMPVGM